MNNAKSLSFLENKYVLAPDCVASVNWKLPVKLPLFIKGKMSNSRLIKIGESGVIDSITSTIGEVKVSMSVGVTVGVNHNINNIVQARV